MLRYLILGFLAFGGSRAGASGLSRLFEASLVPALSLSREQLAGGLALLGTTLTSYVYVWETIGRGVEEPPDGTAPTRSTAQTPAASRRRRCQPAATRTGPNFHALATIPRMQWLNPFCDKKLCNDLPDS